MTPAELAEQAARPRVEGEREQEILDATLDVLAEVGYDRLTMDAVATAAKASKATLYRRWESKSSLVVEALASIKPAPAVVDTGSLREDLLGTFCSPQGGLTDGKSLAIFASVITAIGRDADFAQQYREKFIAPRIALSRAVYERARDRGELRDGVDLDLLIPALPGIILHRAFLLGEQPTEDVIGRIVDQIILPAATGINPKDLA